MAPAHLRLGANGRIKEKTLQPTFDFRDAHFYRPATVSGWNIVNLDPSVRTSEVEQALCQCFPRLFNMLNVKFPSKPSQVVEDIHALKLMPENDKDVVTFVILESSDSAFYVKVKKFFDDRSLTSQCLQSKKAFAKGMNINMSYGMNVCYKVNSKLFGVNATVGPQSPLCPVGETPPIMVLGYDCHHPPVGVTTGSMGCCVASLDGTYGLFAAEFMNMPSRKELHAPLEQPLKILLDKYKKRNHKQGPPAILMFRDGVGQSQVDAVRRHEIPLLRDVFKGVPICVVMASKHHHIRIYKDGGDQVENPDAGTMVDHDIVRENCFILCSHAPALGTSHPTIYEVIVNDNPNWNMRQIIEMTRDLCYLNPRCTKAGSIPAPITHAHLAANRARKVCQETKVYWNCFAHVLTV